uniref:Uncharacterized protein n=1 Tax=Glossina palpalis gambiensis TaxID=67801 RepID=A0A1B0B2D4_9MUSC
MTTIKKRLINIDKEIVAFEKRLRLPILTNSCGVRPPAISQRIHSILSGLSISVLGLNNVSMMEFRSGVGPPRQHSALINAATSLRVRKLDEDVPKQKLGLAPPLQLDDAPSTAASELLSTLLIPVDVEAIEELLANASLSFPSLLVTGSSSRNSRRLEGKSTVVLEVGSLDADSLMLPIVLISDTSPAVALITLFTVAELIDKFEGDVIISTSDSTNDAAVAAAIATSTPASISSSKSSTSVSSSSSSLFMSLLAKLFSSSSISLKNPKKFENSIKYYQRNQNLQDFDKFNDVLDKSHYCESSHFNAKRTNQSL